MNILHHKSWHVRNKDNIKRVRDDEAKAAEEEKEKQKRKAIAESEARLNLLRSKAITKDDSSNTKHINLFEQEEHGKFTEEKNPETELEKKQDQEKFEKKIGLLKYLVDDKDLDFKSQPWYKKRRDKDETNDSEIDLKRKLDEDPLTDINAIMKEHDKKKKKKKKEKNKSPEPQSSVKRSKTIEELRAERLKRESEERLKADRLLYAPKESTKPTVELDDRKRKYNSQYNPEFSKY